MKTGMGDSRAARTLGGFPFGTGELWALGAALAYSLDNVFAANAVRGTGIDSILGAGLRSIPVLIFALIMALTTPRRNPKALSLFTDWKLVAAVMGNGVLTFGIGNPLLFAAFRAGGVAVATPIVATQVLWSGLLAVILLKEPLSRRMLLGMGVCILGVVVLTLGKSQGSSLQPGWWLSVPYALGTALCWAMAAVLITYAMRRGVDRFQALAFALFVGLASLNGYLYLQGKISLYSTTPANLILKVIIAGAFNMVALVSVTTALSLTTVVSASILSSLQAGFAPLIAWVFLGEPMNLGLAVGIVMILLGAIAVQQARNLKAPVRPASDAQGTT
jgi:drug/metabolite transporter (DMT)-like permease